ncbi:hypothetical protein T439DRAFT_325720 [Meredithblackwellia eburnea MCA 4105]
MQFIQTRDPLLQHHHWPSESPSVPITDTPASLTSTSTSTSAPASTNRGRARQLHPSGWNVDINLNQEGRSTDWGVPQSRWRSGEALRGNVVVSPWEGWTEPPRKIESVIVRAFWQSTTVYVTRVQSVTPKRMMKRDEPVLVVGGDGLVDHAEWHRGYLDEGGEGTELWEEALELERIGNEVEGDFPLLLGGRRGEGDEENSTVPLDPRDVEIRAGTTRTSTPTPGSGHDPNTPKAFEFSFALPTVTRSTFSNPSPSAPADRGTLMNFHRTPPPSFDSFNYRKGAVEWFVEVLVRTKVSNETVSTTSHQEEEQLPSFPMSVDTVGQHDFRGLLESTPNLLVERLKFPFEPLDEHSQDLYSGWNSKDVLSVAVPSFGRDPRDELGGSNVARDLLRADQVAEPGAGWLTYAKETSVKPVLGIGRINGILTSQISLPFPPTLPRHSLSIPIRLHFNYTPSVSKFSLASKSSSKPLVISHVALAMYERVLTRSGRAERPTMVLNELRRQTIKLWDSDCSLGLDSFKTRESVRSRSSTFSTGTAEDGTSGEFEGGRRHLRIRPSESVDLTLEFDLQSDDPVAGFGPDEHRPMVKLRDVGLTLRTPNIEREFFLSATIHPVGLSPFPACRCPVQLLAGDGDAAPRFEDIVAAAGGLAVNGTTSRVAEPGDSELPLYV